MSEGEEDIKSLKNEPISLVACLKDEAVASFRETPFLTSSKIDWYFLIKLSPLGLIIIWMAAPSPCFFSLVKIFKIILRGS